MTEQSLDFSIWETAKGDFQSLFPHDVYRTWFEPLECTNGGSGEYVISVPNDFAAIWIEENYADIISQRLRAAAGSDVSVRFSVADEVHVSDSSADSAPLSDFDRNRSSNASAPAANSNRVSSSSPMFSSRNQGARMDAAPQLRLNPKNTFENFVVGPGSQLAHAACIAVAGAPARAYNPLFLYGDTGLGKTHLMHAVAHHVLTTNPDAKIAYISTEKFTNEFIEAIQTNSVTKFRKRYRQVDALLIDDIHFLSGKERIQEEFFHTFNELFESQKQIFLSSDRPAGEISKLESRLVSRFQWGLVADIQAPDFETRLAILTKKARSMSLDVPESILEFMAERISRNVRRMEGALIKVASYASLGRGTLSIERVEELLQDIILEESQSQVTVEKIQAKVADYHNLRQADMTSKRRPANIAFPRQIAMYLSRMLTSHSLQEIGDVFGGRDHGTVIHACKTVENIMEQDDSVRRTVEYLQKQLGGKRS